MKAGAFRKKAATASFNSRPCASVLQASLVEYNGYHRRGNVQPPRGVDPAIPWQDSAPPGTTQGGFTSPHLHGFALRLSIFIYTQTSDRSSFVLLFDYLTVLYLQNIFRACKRLLCCSVKSCCHWAESHLWLQRACTRPGTAQEHRGSYTCPPCSPRSAEAPGAFSGRFAPVQTELAAPLCCCQGSGERECHTTRKGFPNCLYCPTQVLT